MARWGLSIVLAGTRKCATGWLQRQPTLHRRPPRSLSLLRRGKPFTSPPVQIDTTLQRCGMHQQEGAAPRYALHRFSLREKKGSASLWMPTLCRPVQPKFSFQSAGGPLSRVEAEYWPDRGVTVYEAACAIRRRSHSSSSAIGGAQRDTEIVSDLRRLLILIDLLPVRFAPG
jgi:hypothetical protein